MLRHSLVLTGGYFKLCVFGLLMSLGLVSRCRFNRAVDEWLLAALRYWFKYGPKVNHQ